MSYIISHTDYTKPLLQRLLDNRGISCACDDFLNPNMATYRHDPFLLHDMDIGTDRIIRAIKNKESICIFGDYDVDGVTSSFLLYTLLHDYLGHKAVKIMYPDRLADGYGLKVHHVDTIKSKWHDLIITVDNGITSIQEVMHAKNIGLDIIITDHHKALDVIPPADAIINPQVSPLYPFHGICGAGVVLKLTHALLKKSKLSPDVRQSILNHFIPIVAIATVADCVPLINENRALVKRWLAQINRREQILPSLAGMLDFLNIKGDISSFHIGFVIGPRINAAGRMGSGYDSLQTLLYTGEKQKSFLRDLDTINDERKRLQEEAAKVADTIIDPGKNILIAMSPTFHEGIVGIVAGRITEKYHKPSVILHISETKGMAIGSLRWPDYFDVMAMMQWIQKESLWLGSIPDTGILVRFGGHKQAGWLSVNLADIDLLRELLIKYTDTNISEVQSKKVLTLDTVIQAHEWNNKTLHEMTKLEPFGQWNQEPLFLLEDTNILSIEKVGSKGQWHLKVNVDHQWNKLSALYRSKGDMTNSLSIDSHFPIIGKIKYDDYKGSYYIDGTLLTQS